MTASSPPPTAGRPVVDLARRGPHAPPRKSEGLPRQRETFRGPMRVRANRLRRRSVTRVGLQRWCARWSVLANRSVSGKESERLRRRPGCADWPVTRQNKALEGHGLFGSGPGHTRKGTYWPIDASSLFAIAGRV
jgi:hypothetical protein